MIEGLIRLCALDEMQDPGGREFSWSEKKRGGGSVAFFLVRQGNEVFGYANQCPHAGHQLNWMPDRFLTREGDLILCNSHGARFRVEDRLCVTGPCPGEYLRLISLEVCDQEIFAREDQLRSVAALASRFS